MLRLLISNCGQTGVLRGLVNIPRLQYNLTARAKDFTRINARNYINSAKNARSGGEKGLRGKSLLLGGLGVSVGLCVKGRTFLAKCEANRLEGVTAKTIRDIETNFDWKRFWMYLKPHLLEFIGAIIAALAVAYFNIQIPNMLGKLINTLSKYAGFVVKDPHSNQFLSDVKKPALGLFGMYLLQSGFTFLYILLLSRIGERMAAKLRQDLFKQIIIQDLAFFDKNRTGELVNRLTADIQDFKSSFKQFVSQGLRSVAQLVGGSISLFMISPHMAAIALAAVPAAVAFMSLLGGTLRNLSKKAQAQTERATSVCEEALSNIRTVRSSACEYTEIKLFEKETDLAAEMSQELGYGIAVFQALTNFLINGMVLSTLFFGGHLMSTDSLSPGQLMAFLVASQGVQRSLAQGSILLGTLIRGMTAGTRVFEYLAIEPEIDLLKGIMIPDSQLRGEIRFQNITFSYPTRKDQVVLKNFNLTLRPGETVALVGASGSGKSTVAALLERFYEPTSGQITIDGYNLRLISPYWLRSELIGFIEQQPILFATTILENIRYGQPNATVDQITEVAKLSQSHDFIMDLPDAYDTNVGERGMQLSGGQRQRIAIARALLKQPTILILDEATSALDASSEAVVQRALDTAVVDRTTLIIAHRLSTIRNADLIVVLDKGNIVEMGKHEELMQRRGLYFELVRQQEKEEKSESRAQG